MKRVLCASLAVVLLATAFVNCKKDGVYAPKKKISKVINAHNGTKVLRQSWVWDGDLLSKIEYYGLDSSVSSKTFYFYDKKRLTRIEGTDLSYSVEVTYNGSAYEKLDFFNRKGEKTRTYEFSYDKKKVSKIVDTRYAVAIPMPKSMENEVLSIFIPKIILEEADRQAESSSPKLKSAENVVVVHTMKYKGDNLSEWEILGSNKSKVTFTYESYDENVNPFYTSSPAIVPPSETSSAFYKNNPTKIVRLQVDSSANLVSSLTMTFSYLYDKKFPTEVILTYIMGEHANSDTTYYEYK